MARNIAARVLDDLTGEPAAETVGFGLDGIAYDIDLAAKNAAALRKTLARYVAAGRRTGGRKQRPRTVNPKPAKRTAAAAKATARAVQPAEPLAKPVRSRKTQSTDPARKGTAAKTSAKKTTAKKTTAKKTTAGTPAANKATTKAAEPKPQKSATSKTTTEPKTRRATRKVPAVTFSSGE